MDVKLDATIVDAWTEFISLRDKGLIEDLDEKSRNIIYAVAAAQARSEKINQKGILAALRPRSHMPVLSRINALIRTGWLRAETDPADRRIKNLHLTLKSTELVNRLSEVLKTAVKRAGATIACGVALVTDDANSNSLFLASEFLRI
jgi:hypothetical protein